MMKGTLSNPLIILSSDGGRVRKGTHTRLTGKVLTTNSHHIPPHSIIILHKPILNKFQAFYPLLHPSSALLTKGRKVGELWRLMVLLGRLRFRRFLISSCASCSIAPHSAYFSCKSWSWSDIEE